MNTWFARSLPILLLLLTALLGTTKPTVAQSSPILVDPHDLYRFRISANDLGYILTSNYQEGVSMGFAYDGVAGSIYPAPGPGYTPDPSSGLVPLHRWTVIEDGWRAYTYHSIYYYSHGGNYTYNGIRGYVFPPAATSHTFPNGQTASLKHVSQYYSQDYGFWNGLVSNGVHFAPPYGRGFVYQGLIAAGPPTPAETYPGQSYAVLFNPPPPPCQDPVGLQNCDNTGGQWDPSTCTCSYGCNNPWEEQHCSNSGGWWNSSSCTCSSNCTLRSGCEFIPY